MPPAALEQLAGWAASVRHDDIPDRVVGLAASQVVSQLAAVRAGLRHPLGRRLVAAYGTPDQADPQRAACVTAALGSWLNLDDTLYAGHVGPASVAVAAAYARALGADGRALITAVVVADEVAARLTAAGTLGPLRGQMALHTYLVAAVAGRLAVEGADATVWCDALALALSAPSAPVPHGFFGSDAKVLHAYGPVRAGLEACDAARAGLHGAPDLLEHPQGFLAHVAEVPCPDAVTIGLGRRWHTDTVSFKLRPGGPGIDAAVDCALDLRDELDGVSADDLRSVEVAASGYTLYAGRRAESYLDGAASPLSSLLLTVPYAVATALLTGDLTVQDYAEPALLDRSRWDLADRVHLVHDPAMTADLLTSVAPFGQAVRDAGEPGRRWLEVLCERFGVPAPPDTGSGPTPGADGVPLHGAEKRTPAQVSVVLRDGRRLVRRRDIPLGAAGPDTRARHAVLVRAKFLAQGGTADVAAALAGAGGLSAGELVRTLDRAFDVAPESESGRRQRPVRRPDEPRATAQRSR